MLPLPLPLDFLEATVESCRNRIPEVEECIFLQTDVDKHRLKSPLDIFYPALENAADDVLVPFAFYGVLFEHPIFKKRDAAFEFFDIDDNTIAA